MVREARAALIVRWVGGLAAFAFGIAAAATPLPYEAPDQHLGVASCASSVCHGSVTPNMHYDALLNEFVTWSHQDAHSKAFDALRSPLARRIAAKLGSAPAESLPLCLSCHADSVTPAQRGPRFSLSDGVGCEACHGGAQRWLASHAAADSTYRSNVRQGMFPLADLGERARLCESCHIGNRDKWASHRILGAGHPRLSFELDTYLALQPPHYEVDADYRRRKPFYTRAQTWVQGQIEASRQQLQMSEQSLRTGAGAFPELALFNCVSCHGTSMHRSELHRNSMNKAMPPGSVSLNDVHWRMSWLILRAINPAAGADILAAGVALQRASVADGQQMRVKASALAGAVERGHDTLQRTPFDQATSIKLFRSVLDAALDGEFSDYLGAEQAAMAIELLALDRGIATRLRPQLDELYRRVKADEDFHPDSFVDAARSLRTQCGADCR